MYLWRTVHNNFKANFLATLHEPIPWFWGLLCLLSIQTPRSGPLKHHLIIKNSIHLFPEARFAVRLRRHLHMHEARFICIADSRTRRIANILQYLPAAANRSTAVIPGMLASVSLLCMGWWKVMWHVVIQSIHSQQDDGRSHGEVLPVLICYLEKGQGFIFNNQCNYFTTTAYFQLLFSSQFKVKPGESPRCPDNHDLSKCHHLYDLGRHIEHP